MKTCGGVVKALHTLAETYNDAELAILSMIEECENIRFAWSTLEDWATHSLRGMINCEQLLERLQRSIYSGQLIMTAMEQDLARAMPNAGTFKRHASLVWNEGVLQAHQSRIRGQVAALQLLLQVVSM